MGVGFSITNGNRMIKARKTNRQAEIEGQVWARSLDDAFMILPIANCYVQHLPMEERGSTMYATIIRKLQNKSPKIHPKTSITEVAFL